MSTKQTKTNTINTKSNYFILDGFIYETDLKTVLRKEKLTDCLDLPELKNKLLYPAILKQLQLYINDGFMIDSIKETTENFTTRTVKIENKKEKIIYKNELLKVVKINLKNNTDGSSCLTAKYEPIPENLLNLINRPELAKSINLIKATCFMSKYADLRNYGKTINKKASSAKYIFLANIYGINFYTGNDFKIDDYGDKKSGSLSLFCEIANNFYYLTSNLGNEAENKKTIENLGKQEIIDFLKKHYDLEIEQNQFNFIHFAIYYLIANLEQKKIVKSYMFNGDTEKIWIEKNIDYFFNNFNKPLNFEIKLESLMAQNIFKFGNENKQEIANFLNKDGIWYIQIANHKTNRLMKTVLNQSLIKLWIEKQNNIITELNPTVEFLKADLLFNAAMQSFKDTEKPLKNLLPVLYKTEQKTPVKTTLKPLQIEFKKQVVSLPILREQAVINYSPMIQKIDKDIILTLPVTRSEQIELADYTEITEIHKEATLGNHGGLDNFYELYTAKLREKRAIRKASSKTAGLFNRIMQFSAAAVLCFLFVNTYLNIEKSNSVIDSMAKIETVNPPTVNIADLSDCGSGGIIQHSDKEPVKIMPYSGLNWIGLFGLFGTIRNKRKAKNQIKQQIKTYVLVLNEVKDTIFASRKVKDKIKSAKHKIKILNEFF